MINLKNLIIFSHQRSETLLHDFFYKINKNMQDDIIIIVQQSYGIFTFSLISAKFGALKALPSDSDIVPLRSREYPCV